MTIKSEAREIVEQLKQKDLSKEQRTRLGLKLAKLATKKFLEDITKVQPLSPSTASILLPNVRSGTGRRVRNSDGTKRTSLVKRSAK